MRLISKQNKYQNVRIRLKQQSLFEDSRSKTPLFDLFFQLHSHVLSLIVIAPTGLNRLLRQNMRTEPMRNPQWPGCVRTKYREDVSDSID